MNTLGIDLSLRSTAFVLSDKNGKIIECKLFKTKKTDDICYENLLQQNAKKFKEYLEKLIEKHTIDKIVLESLSFNSKSKIKDVIDAHYWLLKIVIYNLNIELVEVAPREWRKKHNIKPADKKVKELKAELGDNFWKILTVKKLNSPIRKSMDKYIKSIGLNKRKNDAEIWDLADAYFVSLSG